jgi:hypothetical protein
MYARPSHHLQGAAECAACLPGFYSEGATATCDPCPLGRFAMREGQVRIAATYANPQRLRRPQISCAYCPTSSSSYNGTTCQCSIGMYLVVLGWTGTVPSLTCQGTVLA